MAQQGQPWTRNSHHMTKIQRNCMRLADDRMWWWGLTLRQNPWGQVTPYSRNQKIRLEAQQPLVTQSTACPMPNIVGPFAAVGRYALCCWLRHWWQKFCMRPAE